MGRKKLLRPSWMEQSGLSRCCRPPRTAAAQNRRRRQTWSKFMSKDSRPPHMPLAPRLRSVSSCPMAWPWSSSTRWRSSWNTMALWRPSQRQRRRRITTIRKATRGKLSLRISDPNERRWIATWRSRRKVTWILCMLYCDKPASYCLFLFSIDNRISHNNNDNYSSHHDY